MPPSGAGPDIAPARTAGQIADAKKLCREYLDWLATDHGINLGFQGIEEELRGWPGKYAPPTGDILVAYGPDQKPLGCIAVRPFTGDTCEIKRLYTRPEARGSGLGTQLALAIVERARALGYKQAVLDTADFMPAAQRVYEAIGFREIPPYYDNPLPGIRYLGLTL